MQRFDNKQTEALLAVLDHGSFERAAQELRLTPSAISQRGRALEAQLGMPLVERTRRVVRFTPLGNQVVAKAHCLLREAEELSELVQSHGAPLAGPAVKEFIDWIENLSCGVDHLTQANYTVPA